MSLNPISNGVAAALPAQPTRRDAAIASEPMQAGRQCALGLNQLAPEQRVSALYALGERFPSLEIADRQWLAGGVADGFPPLTHGTGLTTQVLLPPDAVGHV